MYNSANAPGNANNLEVWEAELQGWHYILDLIEGSIAKARTLASGRTLLDDLEAASITANHLAGITALKVGRIRRSQTETNES